MAQTQLDDFPVPDLVRTLFEEASDAMLLVEPKTQQIVDVNPMAQKWGRQPRVDFRGQPLLAILRHEENEETWQESLHRTTAFHARDRFLFKAGPAAEWMPVSVSIARLHPAEAQAMALFTLRDQREQRDLMRRLTRAESELRRVLVSVSDVLWSAQVDATGHFQYRYLSPVVEKLTGVDVHSFLRSADAWEKLILSIDLPAWRNFHAQSRKGTSGETEYRLRRPDSTFVWVRENITAVPTEEGGWQLHGILSDITMRKKSDQALLEKNLLEAERFKSLGILAGGLAHDFNNLLTGILGHANLVLNRLPSDSPMRPMMEQVEQGSWRAADLCQQMLACAGKGKRKLQAVQLNRVVEDSLDLLRSAISKKASFAFHPGSDLPPLWIDPSQLRQIFTNLVLNSSEALDDRTGAIMLRTSQITFQAGEFPKSDKGFWHMESFAAGTYLVLEVSDTGCGMSPETQARMFEPFFTTKFTGRGLGLAALLGIIRSYKGGIHVQSAPGVGTTIQVLLPPGQADPNAHLLQEPPPPAATPSTQQTVLLIDDETLVRDTAERILVNSGYIVLSAGDPVRGVDMFKEFADSVHLVLLDFTMPRLDGVEVFREIRAFRPDIPVILMSGFPRDEVLAKFGDHPPSAFLSKPFGAGQLLAVLKPLSVQ